jgi:putative NADH-flavin reductase
LSTTSLVPRIHRDPELSLELLGGPTALIRYAGLQLLADPTPGRLAPVDAVLFSHDDRLAHFDGDACAYLGTMPLVLTTAGAAQRLGPPAEAMALWEPRRLPRPGGGTVTVTAVPAHAGPDDADDLTGDRIGFYLSAAGLPTVYVGGANASLEVVRTVVRRLGSAPVAVLNAGVPVAEAAPILGARLLIAEPGETINARPSSRRKLLIVGGTCGTGLAVAREALARGHDVTIVGRGPGDEQQLPYARHVYDDPMAAPAADVVAGHDAVVSAVTGQCDGDPRMIFVLAAWLVQIAEDANVPRLLWAGVAGDMLRLACARALDRSDDMPELHAEALGHAQALEVLHLTTTPVRWSYFSPPGAMADDLEPSRYRVAAGEWPVGDDEGDSAVALIDYARAAVDELELPQFDGGRFTIAAGHQAPSSGPGELTPLRAGRRVGR